MAIGSIALALLLVVELWFVGYGTIQLWQYSRHNWHPPVVAGAMILAVPAMFCGGWLVVALLWLRRLFGGAMDNAALVSLRALVVAGSLVVSAAILWAVLS
jgi:hypothetical protein